MKHTLEFNLPDDKHLLTCAIRSEAYERCIESIRQSLRSNDKHGVSDEDTINYIRIAIDEMFEEFSE
jgi:hypothetical protein